jgi:hypothetical protein
LKRLIPLFTGLAPPNREWIDAKNQYRQGEHHRIRVATKAHEKTRMPSLVIAIGVPHEPTLSTELTDRY